MWNMISVKALYVGAHEGVSSGTVIGFGKVRKRWSATQILNLAYEINRIDKLPVYNSHWSDKKQIGHVDYGAYAVITKQGLELMISVIFWGTKYNYRAISLEADLELQVGKEWTVCGILTV